MEHLTENRKVELNKTAAQAVEHIKTNPEHSLDKLEFAILLTWIGVSTDDYTNTELAFIKQIILDKLTK